MKGKTFYKNVLLLVLICCGLCMCLCGCGPEKKQSLVISEGMKQTGSLNLSQTGTYDDRGITQEVEQSFASDDKLCVIQKRKSYYEVWLDYQSGGPAQIGKAYAQTLLQAVPDYEKVLEPYLFENINLALGKSNGNYEGLTERMQALFASLPDKYQQELDSFAREMCKGRTGFVQDEKLSYEEAILMQLVPDALRGTACSALSLWGSKTASGNNVICRNLEWLLGSEKQLCSYHAVVHFKNHDKSFTSINILGLTGILTAINDDGVFAAILDVGSDGQKFEYEGKKCYTFELRQALEEFSSAKETGEYMVEQSAYFTYSHNIALADNEVSLCAEDAVLSLQELGKGYSVLRNEKTPLFEGLEWNVTDSLFVLNSFAARDNLDNFSDNESNLVRLYKLNNLFKDKQQLTLGQIKDLLTSEVVDQNSVCNIHSKNVFHTVIVDYESGDIQIAFTDKNGVRDKPEFISIGHY